MKPCTPYQNHHHHLAVVIGSQQDKIHWPYRVKLLSNINTDGKYRSLEIFDRKYFIDKKFKVKCFHGYMTSPKYFYLEQISIVIIHAR